jgi:hypothetical protein
MRGRFVLQRTFGNIWTFFYLTLNGGRVLTGKIEAKMLLKSYNTQDPSDPNKEFSNPKC